MVVRELFAKLGFKVDDKGLKTFESGLGQAKSAMLGLGAVITAGAGAVLGLATHTAHAAEEINTLAVRSGVSADEFQRLAVAASTTGVSSEELASSMTFLNRNMFMAKKGGSEAAKAFGMLGPAVSQAVKRGAPAAEVFNLISDAIANTDDPAKRAALSMAVFGRGGARLIPLLAKGSGEIGNMGDLAAELGAVFDHDAIESSERFIKSLRTLAMIAKGTMNIIGVGLMKVMQPFIDSIVDIRMEAAKTAASKLKDFFVTVFKVSKAAASFVYNIYKAFNAMLRPLGGVLGVAKGVLATFTVLAGGALIAGIGKMAIGIYEMAAAFTFAGNASLIAQAKALAFPILVGLAIIALGLLFEDLYVFITDGGDSMVGLFAEKFPRVFGVIKDVIMGVWQVVGPFFSSIGNFFSTLTDSTKSWMEVLQSVGTIVGELILSFTRLFGMTGQGILSAMGMTGAAQAMGVVGTTNMGNIGGNLGMGQSPASNQQNQVSQQIVVNVGERDDAATIGKKVGDASTGGLNDVFRSAGRNLAPGVAY